MPLEAEYRAAREGAAWIDLSSRGKIEVTGADRVLFLHNILTNDIKNLKMDGFCPAALLSSTAKVLALMTVWKFEDKILLDTEPGLEEKLIPLLEKFIITEDVQLRKTNAEYGHVQITGPKAENRHKIVPLKEKAALIERILGTGAVRISPETAEILRIEEGTLRYGVDVTEEVSLPETGLDDTYASETKGCYPGQEVVARTKTYKGLQRKIVGLVGDDMKAGNKIYSGEKEIGRITSACVSPAFGGIALGYVTKGFFDNPCEVEIKTGAKSFKAKTAALPFYPLSG